MKSQFGLEFVGQQTECRVDIAATLNPPTRPAVVVPAENSTLHAARHFVVAHVCLGAVEQPLELETVCVAVGYHIADLADNRGENEHANEIAHYRENVSAKRARKNVKLIFFFVLLRKQIREFHWELIGVLNFCQTAAK